jgi:hypothetical protein
MAFIRFSGSGMPRIWRRRETLVAIGTGVAIFADLFLRPFTRQGLFHTTFLARLQVIRMPLYFFDDVFRLDLAFKPAQRVFERLAFL